MKSTQSCPKCQSRQLWLIEEMRQPVPESTNHAVSLAVTTMRTSGAPRVDAGTFEAWVCAHCGFTEWYARGANEGLAKLALRPGSGVRWIDTSGPHTTFR
jgi:predicted nucleic-acid-binding Zn-ribbon protein